jgi:hypothetical protein
MEEDPDCDSWQAVPTAPPKGDRQNPIELRRGNRREQTDGSKGIKEEKRRNEQRACKSWLRGVPAKPSGAIK